MRISNQGLLAATVLSVFSGVTIAAEAVDPDTLPRVECSSLHYSEDFLQKYPRAPAACLEARVYKGQTYMKVKAKLYVSDKPMLSVALMDPYGDTLGTVLIQKPQSLRHGPARVGRFGNLRRERSPFPWARRGRCEDQRRGRNGGTEEHQIRNSDPHQLHAQRLPRVQARLTSATSAPDGNEHRHEDAQHENNA